MNCTNNICNDLFINILASIIFLFIYEIIIKKAYFLSKYNYLKGYYLVCSQNGKEFRNSPNGIPNFLIIKINFWNPNVLVIISKDFDKTYSNQWKTWKGKIVMNELTDSHGSGYYLYDEGAEPGLHEIFVKDKISGSILVRITDYGKGNLKDNLDNKSTLQNWKKIKSDDKLVNRFNKILNQPNTY